MSQTVAAQTTAARIAGFETALTNMVRSELRQSAGRRQPLTLRALAVLLMVSRDQTITMKELATRLEVGRSTAQRVVVSLEEAGLMLRGGAHGNRDRALIVQPEGHAYLRGLLSTLT